MRNKANLLKATHWKGFFWPDEQIMSSKSGQSNQPHVMIVRANVSENWILLTVLASPAAHSTQFRIGTVANVFCHVSSIIFSPSLWSVRSFTVHPLLVCSAQLPTRRSWNKPYRHPISKHHNKNLAFLGMLRNFLFMLVYLMLCWGWLRCWQC